MPKAHRSSDKKRSLRKVVAVFKTHFDLGFTDLPHRVMALYTGPMFDAVMGVMQATEDEPPNLQYKWTLPAWPLRYLLHNSSVPENTRASAHVLVETGRLSWHIWPFTTHTAFCGLEDLVRGVHVSRSLSEEFGEWPRSAKQTDVPGHTWILPSLLVRAGVRFLHLGCNPGSHPPHLPRLFWWEGPDGSRLLTYYSVGGYGTSLLPPEDWELDTWLALQHTTDNIGPQSSEELARMRAELAERAPGVEFTIGSLDDFADSLFEHPEQLENLPVVPYDLADTWIHGVGTMPREVARVRALRPKLLELEAIASVVDWGRSADFQLSNAIAPDIDVAYEQLLLFGEHTWGLDVKSTIKRVFVGPDFEAARHTEPYKRLEASWEAKAAYVDIAEAAYKRALATVTDAWRELFDRLHSERVGDKFSQELERELQKYRQQNAQKIDDFDNSSDMPASIPPPSGESSNVIEGAGVCVEVDPAEGCIRSLIDERTGHEYVGSWSDEPFAGYRYDIYSAADIADFLRAYGRYFQDWFVHDFGKQGYPEDLPHVTSYARDFKVRCVNDDGYETLLLEGGKLQAVGPGGDLLPAQKVSIRIVPAGGPTLHLDYSIEGKVATPLSESAVVPFPVNLPKATFRLGQVGSVIDPARDIAKGANHSLWCVDGWIDASDDRMGMALFPMDMPLVSIGDTGIYKFEPIWVPKEPAIYSHLFNTQWGTNFRQWHEGDFHFRIKLMPHAGDWRIAQLWKDTRTFDLGELRIEGMRGVGDLAYMEADPGFVLTALRPRRNGSGVIARYWDAMGAHRPVILKLPREVVRVWRCDLMERPIEQLRLNQVRDKINPIRTMLDVRAHAVETLLIEFGPPDREERN